MRRLVLPIILAINAAAAPGAVVAGERPAMEITVRADRTSQYPLTEEQTRRLDEATKISTALRVFYSLYDRWPKDLDELRGRTTGIDYAMLGDRLKLERVDENMGVKFFDSIDERGLLAQPMGPSDKDSRDDARQPGFTFEVKIHRPDAPQSPAKSAYDDPESPEWARLQQEAGAAMAAELKRFPDVKEAYLLTGFEENGLSKFGVDIVCDGEPNMAAYAAAAAAYARVAPKEKGLQWVLLTPQMLADLVAQAQLQPFYRRP